RFFEPARNRAVRRCAAAGPAGEDAHRKLAGLAVAPAMPLRIYPLFLRLVFLALFGACLTRSAIAANPGAPATPTPTPFTLPWDFFRLSERLPDSVVDNVPTAQPTGSVRLYVRPHFGDLLHRDYL